MLLTLILNLGMAAGVSAEPVVIQAGPGLKARKRYKGQTFGRPLINYDKQKKDDKELLDFLDLLIN